jgi:hypothetical protein
MKANDAVIVWTPATYSAERFGRHPGPVVAVLPYDQRGTPEAKRYPMWVPAGKDVMGSGKPPPSAEAERFRHWRWFSSTSTP